MFDMVNISTPGEIDWQSLKSIVSTTRAKTTLLCRLIKSVEPLLSKLFHSHLVSMKIVVIPVILCQSTHHNNNNYIFFFIALYLYLMEAKVNAIIPFKHFSLSVFYNVLQKKLKNNIMLSVFWIKNQASNCILVGIWNNFKFYENIHGKRVDNIVKFCSVTITLWIKQSWRIPDSGLK